MATEIENVVLRDAWHKDVHALLRYEPDTETHCHCGAAYEGSDHCPSCGCEQYESYSCAFTVAQRHQRRRWRERLVANIGDGADAGVLTQRMTTLFNDIIDALEDS